uniref:TERF1-interacting nuclear factor 2 N-terminal domain-containing protein n=1 Tax=Gasterosteus aculeatus TaxID=69293 RepID=G3N5L5_GASAC
MMEVQQDESRMTSAVDASVWPDVDPRPLGLEDPWRLRVAAARVFSIVKNRDVGRFERAVGFLEATHRLLPGLVASIKHMKITFGLKTLSQREMFLMRKNHLDFKTLAQALAMNKDKLEYYVANQMEEQYGERYAQKVEDRLLHYLQELEAALPGD